MGMKMDTDIGLALAECSGRVERKVEMGVCDGVISAGGLSGGI